MNTPTTPLIVRQGDVLLRQLPQLPTNIEPAQTAASRVILAHGEATGHHHSIPASAADDYMGASGGRVVDIKTPTELTHQEHSAIPLPAGPFEVVRQREYTPASIRNVAD